MDPLPNPELLGVISSLPENSRIVPKGAYVLDHKV